SSRSPARRRSSPCRRRLRRSMSTPPSCPTSSSWSSAPARTTASSPELRRVPASLCSRPVVRQRQSTVATTSSRTTSRTSHSRSSATGFSSSPNRRFAASPGGTSLARYCPKCPSRSSS
ncbi:uncharacterized protein METZ01_LOCUS336771, partial [marine metagenome]